MDGRAEALSFEDDNSDDPEFAAYLASRGAKEPPPEVDEYLSFYWDAWNDLKNDRQIDGAGGCSPIFYTALSQYARDKGLVGSDLDRFVKLLRAMDQEYLKWLADKKPTPEPDK